MILFINELDELRERIKGIDYSIMSLISRRIELAREVGKLKIEKGLPIRNFQVEKQVYERIDRYASEFYLDPPFMRAIYETIIEASVSAQIPIQKQKGKIFGKILIVGGSGKMGSWFADFFSTSGYSVEISDPILHPSYESHLSLPDDLVLYDFIAVCCPLKAMGVVLREIILRKPRGIVFDIASLKSHILDIVNLAESHGVHYISIHPMFGPDVKHLEGRNLIVCESHSSEALQSVQQIFTETSVRLVSVKMVEHDKFMIYSLGLPHFVNLLVGKVLVNSDMDFANITRHAGTTMIKQLDATRELFSENPDLYHSIQNLNNFKSQLYDEITMAINELIIISTNPDAKPFSDFMASTRSYMGEEI